jgi:hypothetical protein
MGDGFGEGYLVLPDLDQERKAILLIGGDKKEPVNYFV